MGRRNRDIFELSKRRLRESAKFNALSPSEKWFWLNLCLFLDDQEEPGVTRWDLDRLARALYCPVEALKSLVSQDVLKGAPAGETCKPFVHEDRRGEEHTLIPAQLGPVWYASAIVRDEYLRQVASACGRRGGGNPHLKPVEGDTFIGASKGVVKGAVKGVVPGPPPPASPPPSPPGPLSLTSTPPTTPGANAPPPPRATAEPAGKPAFKPEAAELPLLLASDAKFPAAWSDWCQHRRELKKPLTPKSVAMQLAELADWGSARAVLAIRHTIARGWQGIREPEPAPMGQRNRNAPPPSPIATTGAAPAGYELPDSRRRTAAAGQTGTGPN